MLEKDSKTPVSKRKNKASVSETTENHDVRQNILSAALSLFAEHGFDGVSIRDIVAKAGVNVSLISYYFGGKENLFRACIEGVSTDYLKLACKILSIPTTTDEFKTRLKIFVEQILEENSENLDTLKILSRELDSNNRFLSQNILDLIRQPLKKVKEYFAGAQANHLIRSDLEPDLLAILFYSVIANQARLDSLLEQNHSVSIKNEEWRKRFSALLVSVICEGILAPS